MYQSILISSIVLTILYSLLIILYRRWFLELPRFEAPSHQIPQTRFSIIIPARNEAENIDRFLPSILEQSYPEALFDVTVINDYSTDDTAQKVQTLQKKYWHKR